MPDRTFFPWASVLRFGLGHLRLRPDAFWQLSLPELRALIGTTGMPPTATRQGLESLMALFPDAPGDPVTTAKDPVNAR
ncbi:uncharacterized phage protein (TIGR02216 family) [Hoeflea halophila]|uniref:Uncharacterized phage protein (TIGR02216 family) n=1 Tax=Hoeflea halophila TaxID=714899 RepID=A0A286ICT9_9HYPH|nr:rcc01693 family protein [Hoeflea halophila]SOE17466.1 uncharacterized phage protein (TIGR02216 family) [Hoeflea halophila]